MMKNWMRKRRPWQYIQETARCNLYVSPTFQPHWANEQGRWLTQVAVPTYCGSSIYTGSVLLKLVDAGLFFCSVIEKAVFADASLSDYWQIS
jgi:hypothetical protein